MVNRYAFTMIELIFAIVIIAIASLSLPMMTQIIAKNEEGSLIQEVIFAASAELNQVISYAWDENSMDDDSSLSFVVWTNATDCDTTTKLRTGHINQPYHRRCSKNSANRPTNPLGAEGDLDDLDDIDTTAHPIFINAGGSAQGYKNTYNSQYAITYASFGTIAEVSQNMKRVSVSITDTTTGNQIIRLITFSANIGEIDYFKRSY